MGYFSSALRDTLQDLGLRQNEFAADRGLQAPQVNRYCSGANLPEPAPLAKILGGVPVERQGALLAAYLRDIIPPAFASTVLVEPVAVRVAEGEWTPLVPGLDRALDSILRRYAVLAMQHPEVRKMLVSFLAALGKLPPEASGE